MRNIKNKINEKPNRNKLLDTEDKLMAARWKGAGRLGEKVRGLESTNWQLQNSPRM